jgi:hypothetical protein
MHQIIGKCLLLNSLKNLLLTQKQINQSNVQIFRLKSMYPILYIDKERFLSWYRKANISFLGEQHVDKPGNLL